MADIEKTLTDVPEITGDDIIVIAASKGAGAGNAFTDIDYTTEYKLTSTDPAPATDTWMQIQETVNTMPQFFPDRETIEYRVLASTQARQKLGVREAIDGAIAVYYTNILLKAHQLMIGWQSATEEEAVAANGRPGYFWLVWYIASQNRTVAVRCNVDDHLKTPENESGELEPFDLQITNVDEAIETNGLETNLSAALTADDEGL